MNIYVKGSDVTLVSNLEPDEFARLVHLHNIGEIHVSIQVSHGERVGYLPLNDLDISRILAKDTGQLSLI